MTIKRIGYVPQDTRWKATVSYEVDNGELREVIHHIWELEELQDLIESGPTFCSIRSFKIDYCGPKETIKEAMQS
jgi:hypothetical protein